MCNSMQHTMDVILHDKAQTMQFNPETWGKVLQDEKEVLCILSKNKHKYPHKN
jgi:hypothetical protein